MQILIVEDKYEKINLIHNLTQSLDNVEIDCARSANDAKLKLTEIKFDLVVIDLQIPEIEGGDISVNGGKDLLCYIETDVNVNTPAYVFGLTEYSDNISQLRKYFSDYGWRLFHIEDDKDVWKRLILSKAKSCCSKLSSIKIDVAILTALEKPELEEVLRSDCNWSKFEIDGEEYHLGSLVSKNDRSLNLLAAASERMGVSSACTLATQIGLRFTPKFMIMTGVCAGVEGKADLGDVIVGDPVWDWGAGKIGEENGERVFYAEPHQIPLERDNLKLAKSISNNKDFLKEVYLRWDKKRGTQEPKIRIGPMACGSQVIANSKTVKDISGANRKVVAIEMESYGFLTATRSLGISSIVAKSVCDFADKNKADESQQYAAHTSASFALELIRKLDFV